MGFPVPCLVKNTMYGGSVYRAHNSPTFLAEVMAVRKGTFAERCNNEQVAFILKGGHIRTDNTEACSTLTTYVGITMLLKDIENPHSRATQLCMPDS